jgi:hypothetical protein
MSLRAYQREATMIKHGEYVAPHIAMLALEDSPPNKVNPDTLNGVVARFDKRVPVSIFPSALNSLGGIYRNALHVRSGGASTQMRGWVLFFSLLAISPYILFHKQFIEVALYSISSSSIHYWFLLILTSFFVFFVFPRWIWLYIRLELFPLEDEPIIFDRKHRKIYCLIAPIDGSSERGWARFRSVPLQAVEYDWDYVTAEHRVQLTGTGQSISRIHQLVLVVRDRRKPGADDPYGRLLDEFSVGNCASFGDTSVGMWWEHLRRYMQTNGPALPEGEALQLFDRPKNLWQSMGVVSPFGPRLMWWWRNVRFPTILILLCFPFTLPFSFGWSICNWIVHMTMRKVIWPQEVRDRIGRVIERVD